ncbi:unnamed protein product [Paramecium sonneborni]|uniref:Uncharacterized protein n=1 Tax=Paramecium sonneborni TaxID=65129 RepID=A0A8S1RRN1_9CILI|nr:unnamed protein product [Paramecium sonneborni]
MIVKKIVSNQKQEQKESIKIDIQDILKDFHPVPVMYSVTYEEFRYRKNEVDQKQQIFVVELVVNEQQLLNTEKGYRRQLRDKIKQIYQSYHQNRNINGGITSLNFKCTLQFLVIIQLIFFLKNIKTNCFQLLLINHYRITLIFQMKKKFANRKQELIVHQLMLSNQILK